MKNGDSYLAIMKAAAASNRRPPPKFIEIEEKTEPWMGFYLTAFYRLSTERSVGMAVGPIPWSKTVQYGQHYGFDGVALDVFCDMIEKMDGHYTKQAAKERKKK